MRGGDKELGEAYDYIVVGGGSSGCAVAYGLAARSDAKVLLLESGPVDNGLIYRMPIGFAMLMGEGKANWNYSTEPEAALDDRAVALPRGRVMGGCSSINGMVYIRGQRQDYDAWAEAGNSGWSYDEVLPVFKRSENYWGGNNDFHGSGGQLEVSPVSKTLPIADAFIEASQNYGIPANSDFNGPTQEGVGYYDANISKGIRHSSARAFLAEDVRPPNLQIVHGFDVERLGFEGSRAKEVVGCYRRRNNNRASVRARQEIIVCAGAYNSPKLLELSGIGSVERLRSLGITPLVDLPGVGENLQDHCNNYVFYSARNAATYFDYIKPLRAPATLFNYLLRHKGIFANPAALVGAFYKSAPDIERPDTQIHFAAAASRPNASGKLVPVPGICASICQLQPQSRGSTHIVSADSTAKPAIHSRFLSTAHDMNFQCNAVRQLRSIMAIAPIKHMLGEELPPLAGLVTDQDLSRGIGESAESVHHPVGTCRMGIDADAVVSPELKVHGVDGLRIADASIMPRITSGNTNAACIMIAEQLVDRVLQSLP